MNTNSAANLTTHKNWRPQTRQRLLRYLLLTPVLLISLNGCSTKMAYGFLDWAIHWYVADYIPLTKEQKKQVKKQADIFHAWHRNTQLVRYADYIEHFQIQLTAREFSAKTLHQESDAVQALLDTSLNKLMPHAITLLADINDKQITALVKNLAKKRKKYRKENIFDNAEKTYARRADELKDFIGPYTGRLNNEQKESIHQWSRSLKDYEAKTLAQQKVIAEQLETALHNRHDAQEFSNTIRTLLSITTDNWEPEIQAIMDYNQELTYTLLANIFNTLTKKQQKRFIRKLDGYIKDLHDLRHAQVNTNKNNAAPIRLSMFTPTGI